VIRIEADRLIDGAGDHPRHPGRVDIEGDRVTRLDGRVGPPPDSVVFSLPGCSLLPGLWDFHSHLGLDTRRGQLSAQVRVPVGEYVANGVSRILEDLRAGVTSVRACGDLHGIDLAVRRAVEEGAIVGPRLVAAGRAIRSPRCSGGVVASVLTDDPKEIEQAVRDNLEAGVDFVKLFISDGVGNPAVDPTTCYYGEAHVAPVVRQAHDAGRPVAAHLLGGPGVAAAIGGGLDVIEHGWFLTDRDLDLVERYGTLITLTTGVLCGPRAHAFERNPETDARLQRLADRALETTRKVIARRIRYVVGTDALHGCLADELAWLVRLGESPMRAILAATAWPAAALGLASSLGTIEVGKVADVIAVEGDPVEDITALSRVRLVVSRGRIVYLEHQGAPA
jgi:imidazolonepropionase-like amidohydrolase